MNVTNFLLLIREVHDFSSWFKMKKCETLDDLILPNLEKGRVSTIFKKIGNGHRTFDESWPLYFL